jgi:hypothetical protein
MTSCLNGVVETTHSDRRSFFVRGQQSSPQPSKRPGLRVNLMAFGTRTFVIDNVAALDY